MSGSRLDGFADFIADTESLNVFRGLPADLRGKYGVNHIVTEREFLEGCQGTFPEDLKRGEPLFKNHTYAVFEVASDEKSPGR